MDNTMTDDVSLMTLASSPQPQTASQKADDKTTDMPTMNMMNAGPAVPADMSHTPPDKPLKGQDGMKQVKETHLKTPIDRLEIPQPEQMPQDTSSSRED